MNTYIMIGIGGMLAIMLHVLVSMQTINNATPKADFNLVWQTYWRTDYLSFAISILAYIIFLWILSEWVDIDSLQKHNRAVTIAEEHKDYDLHSRAAAYIKTFSVAFGYFADYIVYKLIGKTKKVIDKQLSDDDGK